MLASSTRTGVTTRSGAHRRQVFRDTSGRRWRRVRRAAMIAGVVTSVLALALIAAILAPPLLPAVVGEGRPSALVHLPRIATSRRDRARIAARRRLFIERAGRRGPSAMRPGALPLGRSRPAPAASDTAPIVAGFYVNWDDNSFASFQAHIADLDWVVCEWAFVAPGGDSLRLRVDR